MRSAPRRGRARGGRVCVERHRDRHGAGAVVGDLHVDGRVDAAPDEQCARQEERRHATNDRHRATVGGPDAPALHRLQRRTARCSAKHAAVVAYLLRGEGDGVTTDDTAHSDDEQAARWRPPDPHRERAHRDQPHHQRPRRGQGPHATRRGTDLAASDAAPEVAVRAGPDAGGRARRDQPHGQGLREQVLAGTRDGRLHRGGARATIRAPPPSP